MNLNGGRLVLSFTTEFRKLETLCFVSFLLFSTVHHANLVPIHFRSVDTELRSTRLVFCLVKSAFPSWEAVFSMTCIVGGTFYQGLEYLLGSSLPFGL